MILPERSCLTRWYMEKCCGLKAAHIVFATAGQTVAVAVDATGIAAEGMRALSLNRTIKQLKQKRRKQMKIAIPMNEQSLDSDVCPSFGRAPYFLFYNSVTEEAYYLDNEAVASQGGAGIRAAQVIADHGVKALIAPRCGENAADVLTKAEVFVYHSIPGTARQNIEAHLNNQLPLINEFHAGFHGHEKK